jgi:hypothetical protein
MRKLGKSIFSVLQALGLILGVYFLKTPIFYCTKVLLKIKQHKYRKKLRKKVKDNCQKTVVFSTF